MSKFTKLRQGNFSPYIWACFWLGFIHSLSLFLVYLVSPRIAIIASGVVILGLILSVIFMNIAKMTFETNGTSVGWLPVSLFMVWGACADNGATREFFIFVAVFLVWCALYFTPLYRISFPIMYRMAWE